jgi:uncharacterized cupredoxin-like copper-binding protein
VVLVIIIAGAVGYTVVSAPKGTTRTSGSVASPSLAGSEASSGGNATESSQGSSTETRQTITISAIQASQNGPQNFTLTEGMAVVLVFVNNDDSSHELTIPALDVTTGIVQASTTIRLLFTPNETGTFQFGQPGERGLDVLGYVTVVAP